MNIKSSELRESLAAVQATDVDAQPPDTARSALEIQRWLVTRVALATKVASEEVRLDQSFADLHLSSFATVSITNELSKLLGEEFSITLLWEYPTIGEVVEFLTVCRP